MSISIEVSNAWRETFPGARVGVLVIDGVVNPLSHPALEEHARQVEGRLRARFDGADRRALMALPNAKPYVRHYKAFGQNYHVLRQLESVALKQRPLSSPSALVLAMFTVEVETLLLTAGHDVDALHPPLVLDCSQAGDQFVGIGGREQVVRAGDMLIRDRAGIISAVIYGPDARTQLTDQTRRALFTVYAPAGIGDEPVTVHLEQLAANVRLFAPSARTDLLAVFPSS